MAMSSESTSSEFRTVSAGSLADDTRAAVITQPKINAIVNRCRMVELRFASRKRAGSKDRSDAGFSRESKSWMRQFDSPREPLSQSADAEDAAGQRPHGAAGGLEWHFAGEPVELSGSR